MDFKKKLLIVRHLPFKYEFKIKKFKESPILIAEHRLPGRFSGVYLSVRGKGELPENEDCVVILFQKYFDAGPLKNWEESDPPTVICSCIFNILDVQGHEKFPRTFTFENDSKNTSVYEERYIERSCILNDASEYLQDSNALTVLVEGVLDEWDEHNEPLIPHWYPSRYSYHFLVEELEDRLKVFLPNYSIHVDYLLKHSEVFEKMWNAPMREREEKLIPLQNEELPAFLCMLFFLETENLFLYEATIFDLYKIAHMYRIQILLQKCRESMEKYLPKNASAILDFATFYDDTELKRTAKSYIKRHSHEMRQRNENLETGNVGDDSFVCDTLPVSSNLIKTKKDFETHFKNMWKNAAREISYGVVYFNPEFEFGLEREPFDFYQ